MNLKNLSGPRNIALTTDLIIILNLVRLPVSSKKDVPSEITTKPVIVPVLRHVQVPCLPQTLILTQPELHVLPVSTVREIPVIPGLVPENARRPSRPSLQTAPTRPVPTVRERIRLVGHVTPDITNPEAPVFAQRLVPIR